MAPLRITHVISSLDVGGAETMLVRLVTASDRSRFEHRVVSLMDLGLLAAPLREAGVPLAALATHHSLGTKALALPRLVRLLRGHTDVVQTWMYHSNVLGGLAARWLGLPAIWCVRQADLDDRIPRSTRAVARLSGALSARLPTHIVYNSTLGREVHRRAGHDDARASVIPNGFDLQVFRPDAKARAAVRRELGVDDSTPLVGLVARYDPQKDHGTFAAAAGLIASHFPQVRFVLAGRGVDESNAVLMAMLQRASIVDRASLLGHRADVARILSALDVACLSSRGEGFPNTVGEAMACGVPVVATAVGDVRDMVGNAGVVVPARNPEALAGGIAQVLAMSAEERRALGQSGRQRLAQRYSSPQIVAAYEALWTELGAGG